MNVSMNKGFILAVFAKSELINARFINSKSEHNFSLQVSVRPTLTASGVPWGGGLQNSAKLKPIVKTVKNC